MINVVGKYRISSARWALVIAGTCVVIPLASAAVLSPSDSSARRMPSSGSPLTSIQRFVRSGSPKTPPGPSHRLELDDAGCLALAGAAIPADAVGLPTSRASVSVATPKIDPRGTRYCAVLAAIRAADRGTPDINFQLNLPYRWNGKAVQLGGSGFNGTIGDGAERLETFWPARATGTTLGDGYATFRSDSGHSGSSISAEFALNHGALQNYAGDEIKRTRDAAFWLVGRAFGGQPRRLYFVGASKGGQEALVAIRRWPADYDGAVALAPTYNFVALVLGHAKFAQLLHEDPQRWLSPSQYKRLSESALRICDGLDGLEDGIVSNVTDCDARFDIEELGCAEPTAPGGTCLSKTQIAFIRQLTTAIPLGTTINGRSAIPGWPLLHGPEPSAFQFGKEMPNGSTDPARAAFLYYFGDQAIRYIVLGDPEGRTLRFTPSAHTKRLDELSTMFDVDYELSAYERRGGKLILMHGLLDTASSPANTVEFFAGLRTKLGDERLRNFARLYLVPGFGHGTGVFQPGWNVVRDLNAWVEHQRAPRRPTVVDVAKATAGRERPLCEFPEFPQYHGRGDPTRASSFSCVKQ